MKRNKSILLLLLAMAMAAVLSPLVDAAEPDGWHIGAHTGMVSPVGSLGAWFAPTLRAYGLGIAKWQTRGWSWEFSTEALEYSRENTSRLYYRDLELQLNSYSGTVRGGYALWSWRGVCASALVGAGLHRWHSLRGSYQLEEVFVPERRQEDWSWAFETGIGARVALGWGVGLEVRTMYRLIVGELWPTLALRLESVSGMQSVLFTLGLWVAL